MHGGRHFFSLKVEPLPSTAAALPKDLTPNSVITHSHRRSSHVQSLAGILVEFQVFGGHKAILTALSNISLIH